MDELLDMIATDASPTEISDSIKDTLYSKAAERINSQRPDIAMQMFDPTIANAEEEEVSDDSTEEEEEQS
tara:strand:+ start:262 stop:471 length:210 start_codon:yes stop_codon:yes gene_type:complete